MRGFLRPTNCVPAEGGSGSGTVLRTAPAQWLWRNCPHNMSTGCLSLPTHEALQRESGEKNVSNVSLMQIIRFFLPSPTPTSKQLFFCADASPHQITPKYTKKNEICAVRKPFNMSTNSSPPDAPP
ncbi:unnamed protein product [Arctogadus glacialis]